MTRGMKVSKPLTKPVGDLPVVEVVEVVKEKKTRKPSGPRVMKPVQIVVRVVDENGNPLSRKNARVEVILATKDELKAVRAVMDAIDADDESVQNLSVKLAVD